MKKLVCTVLAVAGLACSGLAAAGQCRDARVTQAVKEVLQRSPNGSGSLGECDSQRYGNGHWSSYDDLLAKVRAANGMGIAVAVQPRPGAAENTVASMMVNRSGAQVGSTGGANAEAGARSE